MPCYDYTCDRCGRIDEDVFQLMKEEAFEDCPMCRATGTYHKVPCISRAKNAEYRKPIEMHSLGLCHHDDIVAFKKRYPDIEMSHDPKHPNYGVPVVKNRQQKLHVLNGEGWKENNGY